MNRSHALACLACLLAIAFASSLRAEEATEVLPVAEKENGPPALVSVELWVVTLATGDLSERSDEKAKWHGAVDVSRLPTMMKDKAAVQALITRLKNAGFARQVREYRLTSLSGHLAMQQAGEEKAQITATSASNRGVTNSVTFRNVGTILQLTPRCGADGWIRVKIDFAASDLRESRAIALTQLRGSEPVYAPEPTVLHLQTVVRLKDGSAMLVGTVPDRTHPENDAHVFILSATVVEPAP